MTRQQPKIISRLFWRTPSVGKKKIKRKLHTLLVLSILVLLQASCQTQSTQYGSSEPGYTVSIREKSPGSEAHTAKGKFVETESIAVPFGGKEGIRYHRTALYFLTRPRDPYVGSSTDLGILLSPEESSMLEDSGRISSVRGSAVLSERHPVQALSSERASAAVIEPLRYTYKATAGDKGMHLALDLNTGRYNVGLGLLADVLVKKLEVRFLPGTLLIDGKEFVFEQGARVYASTLPGQVAFEKITFTDISKAGIVPDAIEGAKKIGQAEASSTPHLGRFAVMGVLRTSAIWGPEEQLRHYRITDQSGKTICYVVPTDQASNVDLTKFLGQRVGLIGIMEPHPQLATALVRFSAIELLLETGEATAIPTAVSSIQEKNASEGTNPQGPVAVPVLKPAAERAENNSQSRPDSAIVRLRCKEISLGKVDPDAVRLMKWDPLSGGVGPMQFMLAVSPDARRVAYAAKRDGKEFVIVNGRAGKLYDDIYSWPSFSPDGKHLVYVANQGQKKLLVIDGNEVGGYEDYGQVLFSPDGKRWAYIGIRQGYKYVVIDGVEGKARKEMSHLPLFFSVDGKHLAYEADDYIVIDGVEQKLLGNILGIPWVLSPDGTRTAYRVENLFNEPRDQPDLYPVIDGVLIRKHCVGSSFVFSPDSKHVCYDAFYRNDKTGRIDTQCIVIDGIEGKRYNNILSTPVFSPDSKRLAYIAGRDSQQIVVIDGSQEGDYKQIRDDSLVFSPDSQRLAYVASGTGKRWVVIINGSEGETYDDIGADGVIFGPDSTRFAYTSKKAGKWFVISDIGESKSYDHIGPGTITFDTSSTHLAWAAGIAGKWVIVVDGFESREYDSLLPKARLIFDTPGYSRTLCFDNDEFLLVEISLDDSNS